MRILHVITSLSTGGAEVMLRNVALGLPETFEQRVVSLTSREPIGAQLERNGVNVAAVRGKNPLKLTALWLQARRWVSEWRPDVIHCWMYHANVFGRSLISHLPQKRRPIYLASVRGGLNSPQSQRRALRLVRWIDARCSHSADALLFNSRVSAAQHCAFGYDAKEVLIIPNGFDTTRFAPNDSIRATTRAELGVGDELLLGMVARYEPVKGHDILLQAAALAKGRTAMPFRIVLAGRGCSSENRTLQRHIVRLGIDGLVVLLGERPDVSNLLNGFDIVICPSLSESFPNAVGEAMSSGVPCIVSDVGDCAFLVGDTGLVTEPGSPEALANRIVQMIELGDSARRALGERARARITTHFSIPAVLESYASMYERLVAKRHYS